MVGGGCVKVAGSCDWWLVLVVAIDDYYLGFPNEMSNPHFIHTHG